MRPTLYTFSGAPRGWRVLLGLAFKGIDADIRILSVSEKDHQKPDFLAMNPRAKVPVLTSGDIVLRDSIAILAWLDKAYPDKPLFGETPTQAATVWQIAMECREYLREANRQLLSRAFFTDAKVPDEGSENDRTFQKEAAFVHAECRYLEDLLSDDRTFLAGEMPSAADALAFPEVRLLQRAVETRAELMTAAGFGYPPDLYPNVAAWKNRMNAMPEVVATMPPHWQTETPIAKSA
ncbi:MAG: glutathione S-transferase family protein [Roseibium sp.]|uniref:glutathione S-transferase family protein n=1 Tax=Roseibium sp. TaxID=1936156 RepID=UPI0026378685|nr:glutathione S-transferase family protein [Roseibium sp.]MCV0429741.1 glutathione S-transferase family protein [Roseibium sp.]